MRCINLSSSTVVAIDISLFMTVADDHREGRHVPAACLHPFS